MIYILDSDITKISVYLDDKSLDNMIKDIAKTLFMVHYLKLARENKHLEISELLKQTGFKAGIRNKDGALIDDKFTQWGTECRANYLYLVELGLACNKEYTIRTNFDSHKLLKVLAWCKVFIPDLPDKSTQVSGTGSTPVIIENYTTSFPLVIPKRYIATSNDLIKFPNENGFVISYRSYYQSKLKQKQCLKHDACIYAKKGYCLKNEITWTNRQKPEWMEI